MIVSFAWTTEALLAGRKKRTRRYWSADYAKRFKEGSQHQAYNRLARVGGHQVGTIILAQAPYIQPTNLMSEEDYELEGLKYMEEKGLYIPVRTIDGKRVPPMHPRRFFEVWREKNANPFVIDFDFHPLLSLVGEVGD